MPRQIQYKVRQGWTAWCKITTGSGGHTFFIWQDMPMEGKSAMFCWETSSCRQRKQPVSQPLAALPQLTKPDIRLMDVRLTAAGGQITATVDAGSLRL